MESQRDFLGSFFKKDDSYLVSTLETRYGVEAIFMGLNQ